MSANEAHILPVDPVFAGRTVNKRTIRVHAFGWTMHVVLVIFAYCAFLFCCVSVLDLARIDAGLIWFLCLPFIPYVLILLAMLDVFPPGIPLMPWLSKHFLRHVELTSDPVVSPYDPDTRVIARLTEPIKKARPLWPKDLMLLRLDDQGLWMKGDHFRYLIPRESIIRADLNQDSLGFKRYVVIVLVHAADGDIELPIMYFDHTWRDWPRERRRQAFELAERINRIAGGFANEPDGPPEVTGQPSVKPSINPYHPPAVISDDA